MRSLNVMQSGRRPAIQVLTIGVERGVRGGNRSGARAPMGPVIK